MKWKNILYENSLGFNLEPLWKSLLIKKTRSVCLYGYTFRHALMSHADILDIDRGHIFRKHRHKNNKKVRRYLCKVYVFNISKINISGKKA